MIEKVRLVEFRSYAEIVLAISIRNELIAANFDPVLRHGHPSRILGIDLESERRAPDTICYKLHLFTVPREKERTRLLQPMLQGDTCVRLQRVGKLGAYVAVWP